MIVPTKYMDLRTSLISVASTILELLVGARRVTILELDETVQNRLGTAARFNFLSALNFLFLVGVLDYDSENDVAVLRARQ